MPGWKKRQRGPRQHILSGRGSRITDPGYRRAPAAEEPDRARAPIHDEPDGRSRGGRSPKRCLMPPNPSPLRARDLAFKARFTRGSVLRHVLVMTGTGTVGTLSIFVVDLLSLIYVSRLGATELKAAVGFATQVMVYPIAINIGVTIAITAAVSRALGGDHRARARRIAASGLLIAGLLSAARGGGVLARFADGCSRCSAHRARRARSRPGSSTSPCPATCRSPSAWRCPACCGRWATRGGPCMSR